MEILKEPKLVLKGRGIIGGVAEGVALVTRSRISALGGIDPQTGLIIEKGHEIEAQSIRGKVLVFPYGKGSDSWGGIFYAACKNGNGPVAVINRKVDSFVINGVLTVSIPLVVISNEDPCSLIESGDHVKVDAEKGVVKVYKK